jgi:hypothetical protein
MASLRESDAEDSLNSALLGILLRRIRFSPNEKCSKCRLVIAQENILDRHDAHTAGT